MTKNTPFETASSKRHFGGASTFAFKENGVAMLSSVLHSKRAFQVNIEIMRTVLIIKKECFTLVDNINKLCLIANH